MNYFLSGVIISHNALDMADNHERLTAYIEVLVKQTVHQKGCSEVLDSLSDNLNKDFGLGFNATFAVRTIPGEAPERIEVEDMTDGMQVLLFIDRNPLEANINITRH